MYSNLLVLAIAAVGSVVSGLPTGDTPALVPRDCSAEVAAYNVARAEKRGLNSRSLWLDLQNTTCILSPESPKDNYVSGMPVTSNIAGGQAGIAFTLDVGLMDITTCQPLANTMVEVWSPNALGNYGNFLRGAALSGSNGIAEFQTIFPGWSDGANHFNIAVHTQSSLSSSVAHVGKLYFTDKWTTIVGMTSPYNQNTRARTMDLDDSNYRAALAKGYSPVVSVSSITDDWPEGVVGIITVGVNPH